MHTDHTAGSRMEIIRGLAAPTWNNFGVLALFAFWESLSTRGITSCKNNIGYFVTQIGTTTFQIKDADVLRKASRELAAYSAKW